MKIYFRKKRGEMLAYLVAGASCDYVHDRIRGGVGMMLHACHNLCHDATIVHRTDKATAELSSEQSDTLVKQLILHL
jgi:hypothetical protein